MEIKDFAGAALILLLVGLIVGVGVLTLDKFGDAAKTRTTEDYADGVAVCAGGTCQLDNDEVVTLLAIGNTTGNYSVGTQANLTNGELGIVTLAYPAIANNTYLASYTYDADSTTTTNVNYARDAVGGISSNWMALVVTIVVLALILGFVLRSFGGARR